MVAANGISKEDRMMAMKIFWSLVFVVVMGLGVIFAIRSVYKEADCFIHPPGRLAPFPQNPCDGR